MSRDDIISIIVDHLSMDLEMYLVANRLKLTLSDYYVRS